MNAPNNDLRVKFWDLGPKRPEAPDAPTAPAKAKDMTAGEFAALEVEHEDAVEDYKRALRNYSAQRKEYDTWRERVGGPVQLENWSVDVREALERDPERFVRELPKGMKPGRQHYENMERARQQKLDVEDAARRDPQFGEKAQGVAA